ncbi:MAG: hypothetical protein ACN6PR_11765, partial [Achromobacter sp.]
MSMIFGNEGVQYSRLKGDRKVWTLAAVSADPQRLFNFRSSPMSRRLLGRSARFALAGMFATLSFAG